jgi:hypothetical protein
MTSTMSQNLIVMQEGDHYKAFTDFTHELLHESSRASETIQGAIDALSEAGGEVILGRGLFPLDQEIRLGENVWLRGSGRGTKLRLISGHKSGIGLLCEGLKGTVISDLALLGTDRRDSGAGIVVDGCGDTKVRDVFVAGFDGYGIWVRNHAFLCEIRGCSLAGNEKAAIYLDSLREGKYGDYIPNLVTNCMIYGGGKGIEARETIVLNIIGCCAYQTRDIAFHIHTTSNSVLISGCRSFQIGSHAVVVENTHEFNLSSNIFCWHTGHGVLIRDAYWGTIAANEVIDTGSYNSGVKNFTTTFDQLPTDLEPFDAIRLEHVRGYNVTGNSLFNWQVAPKMGYGIIEDAASYNNTITGNNVNYYQYADVLSMGNGSVTAYNIGKGDFSYDDEAGQNKTVQSFRREMTDLFIAEQIA